MANLRYMISIAKRLQKNYYNQPRIKGLISELEVRSNLFDEEYVIYNLILGESKKTQIDHIVINSRGIFVIETKNYTGIITGKDDDKNWIQIINDNKFYFFSPVLQNEFHIKIIKNYILEDIPIYSIIAFSSKSKLNVKVNKDVIHINELKETINKKPDVSVPDQKQKKIYTLLMEQKNKNSW